MSRTAAFARRPPARALCVLLAICTVFGSMVSNAVALHEVGHEHGNAHCFHAGGPVDRAHGAADDPAPASDGEEGLSGALHDLAHAGHCCAPGSAVPSDSLASAGHRAHGVMLAGPDYIHTPQAPSRLFRPPIPA